MSPPKVIEQPIAVMIDGRALREVIEFTTKHGPEARIALAVGLLNLLESSTGIVAGGLPSRPGAVGLVQIIADRSGVNAPVTGFSWGCHAIDRLPAITWPEGRRHLLYNGGLIHWGPDEPAPIAPEGQTVDISRLTSFEALKHRWSIHT